MSSTFLSKSEEHNRSRSQSAYPNNQSHPRHHLPEAPDGVDWVYDANEGRWALRPLQSASFEVLGPAEEVSDTLEHWIQPTDTFQGLLLKYKITATQLRRANKFSGTNLSLAPNPLLIPNAQNAARTYEVVLSKSLDEDKLVQAMATHFQDRLAVTEIKSYLSLNDWDVNKAIDNAQQDLHNKKLMDPDGETARFDTPLEHVVIDEELG